jgi:hypothetical protein
MTLMQLVSEHFGSPLSAFSVIPSVLRTSIHLNTTVMRKKSGANPWNFQCNYVSDAGGGLEREVFLFFSPL